MFFDDGVLAEGFRPEEVRFAEDTTKESTCETEEDENQVVDRVIVDFVIGFEENKLSGSGRIPSELLLQ